MNWSNCLRPLVTRISLWTPWLSSLFGAVWVFGGWSLSGSICGWVTSICITAIFRGFFWILLIVFIAYLFGISLYEHHMLYISPDLFTRERHGFIGVAIVAGLAEELVFRGFFMNRLLDRYRFMTANIIQSLLFLGIHLPIYFADHLSALGWLNNGLTVLPLGLIFGWIFFIGQKICGQVRFCIVYGIQWCLFCEESSNYFGGRI